LQLLKLGWAELFPVKQTHHQTSDDKVTTIRLAAAAAAAAAGPVINKHYR